MRDFHTSRNWNCPKIFIWMQHYLTLLQARTMLQCRKQSSPQHSTSRQPSVLTIHKCHMLDFLITPPRQPLHIAVPMLLQDVDDNVRHLFLYTQMIDLCHALVENVIMIFWSIGISITILHAMSLLPGLFSCLALTAVALWWENNYHREIHDSSEQFSQYKQLFELNLSQHWPLWTVLSECILGYLKFKTLPSWSVVGI